MLVRVCSYIFPQCLSESAPTFFPNACQSLLLHFSPTLVHLFYFILPHTYFLSLCLFAKAKSLIFFIPWLQFPLLIHSFPLASHLIHSLTLDPLSRINPSLWLHLSFIFLTSAPSHYSVPHSFSLILLISSFLLPSSCSYPHPLRLIFIHSLTSYQ